MLNRNIEDIKKDTIQTSRVETIISKTKNTLSGINTD